MTWGVNLNGLGIVLNALDDLEMAVTTDAVYVTGSSVEYAVYQEFGTSKMEANPYLRPAARDAQRNLGAIAQGADDADDLIRLIALYIEQRAKHYASTGVPPGPDVQTGNLRSSISAERVK